MQVGEGGLNSRHCRQSELHCAPPLPREPYVEALTPMATVLRGRTCEVKRGHQGGALVQQAWCPVSRGRKTGIPLSRAHRQKAMRTRGRWLLASERDLASNRLCWRLDLGLPAPRTVREQAYNPGTQPVHPVMVPT